MGFTKVYDNTGGSVDLSDYTPTDELVPTLSPTFIDNAELAAALAVYTPTTGLVVALDPSFVNNSELTAALANYVTTAVMTSTLGGYVTSTVFTSTLGGYVADDDLVAALAAYATRAYVDGAVEAATGVDMSAYTQTVDLVAVLDPTFIKDSELATTLAGYVTSTSLTTTLLDYPTNANVDSAIASALEDYVLTSDFYDFVTGTSGAIAAAVDEHNHYPLPHPEAGFATQTYVDDAIAAIDTSGAEEVFVGDTDPGTTFDFWYDTTEALMRSLPPGGEEGQILSVGPPAQFTASPEGGEPGQILAKGSDADYDFVWIDNDVPTDGAPGQVLAVAPTDVPKPTVWVDTPPATTTALNSRSRKIDFNDPVNYVNMLSGYPDMAGRLGHLQEESDTTNARVTTVDGRVTTVDGRVTTVDNKVTALDTKVTTVSNKVDSVDAKVNAIPAPVPITRIHYSVWTWYNTVVTAPIALSRAGLNQDIPSAATQMWIHRVAALNGIDWGALLGSLKAGDKIYMQVKADSTVWQRWSVTGPSVLNTNNFVIPIATLAGSASSSEPGNGVDTLISFQYSTGVGSDMGTLKVNIDGEWIEVSTNGTDGADAVLTPDSVDNTILANMANNRIKGNNAGSTGDPVDLTPAQARSVIASDAGGTTNYLRADGTFATPPDTNTNTLGPDGDKGDITVGGTGTTLSVDNDAITYAKIQNVSATDKLLGRSTSGAGDIEEIACTSTGRSLIAGSTPAAMRTTLSVPNFTGTAAITVSSSQPGTAAVGDLWVDTT